MMRLVQTSEKVNGTFHAHKHKHTHTTLNVQNAVAHTQNKHETHLSPKKPQPAAQLTGALLSSPFSISNEMRLMQKEENLLVACAAAGVARADAPGVCCVSKSVLKKTLRSDVLQYPQRSSTMWRHARCVNTRQDDKVVG